MPISLILLAVAMSAMISIYLPMMTQPAEMLGSAPTANVPSFAVAFVASVLIAPASGRRVRDFAEVGAQPLWLLSAGVMSAAMVFGGGYLVTYR